MARSLKKETVRLQNDVYILCAGKKTLVVSQGLSGSPLLQTATVYTFTKRCDSSGSLWSRKPHVIYCCYRVVSTHLSSAVKLNGTLCRLKYCWAPTPPCSSPVHRTVRRVLLGRKPGENEKKKKNNCKSYGVENEVNYLYTGTKKKYAISL